MTEIECFSLPLASPLETARGTIDAREGFLVRTTDDATKSDGSSADGGPVGLGEATPLPGWTENLAECERALREGVQALDAGNGWDAALAACSDAPAARHALDLARVDLAATRASVPLYRHLGAKRRVESVPGNATVGDADVAETVAAARRAIDAGFDCLKVKAGARSVETDLERVRAVREAVGPAIEIRADANGAWSRAQAREAFAAFAEHGVSYVEQPLPADDLDGLAELRSELDTDDETRVKLAVDETLAETDVRTVLDARAADVLVLKPMALGGVTTARRVAIAARERGVDVVVTTTVDGVVARTGAVHLAASLPDVLPCGLATADLLAADLGPDPAPVADGEIAVPQRNGLGVREVSTEDA